MWAGSRLRRDQRGREQEDHQHGEGREQHKMRSAKQNWGPDELRRAKSQKSKGRRGAALSKGAIRAAAEAGT
jgi:hypothetical protein